MQDDKGRAAYAQIMGTYAPQGQCANADLLWMLAAETVTRGRLACEIHSLQIGRNGRLIVRTRDCTQNRAAVADQVFWFDVRAVDLIEANDGKETMLLRRCPFD